MAVGELEVFHRVAPMPGVEGCRLGQKTEDLPLLEGRGEKLEEEGRDKAFGPLLSEVGLHPHQLTGLEEIPPSLGFRRLGDPLVEALFTLPSVGEIVDRFPIHLSSLPVGFAVPSDLIREFVGVSPRTGEEAGELLSRPSHRPLQPAHVIALLKAFAHP